MERLPYIDDHATTIGGSRDRVWAAVLRTAEATAGGAPAPFVRALGLRPAAATPSWSGAVGEAIPGFAVVDVVPNERLVLRGGHRFSAYELAFRLEGSAPDAVELHATTHAAFPGVLGRIYRTLVIGSGAHKRVTRRLLRDVKRRAA